MINKFSKKLFQYYLPVTLTLFMLFTEKRTVTVDDGGYDRLFGLSSSIHFKQFWLHGLL